MSFTSSFENLLRDTLIYFAAATIDDSIHTFAHQRALNDKRNADFALEYWKSRICPADDPLHLTVQYGPPIQPIPSAVRAFFIQPSSVVDIGSPSPSIFPWVLFALLSVFTVSCLFIKMTRLPSPPPKPKPKTNVVQESPITPPASVIVQVVLVVFGLILSSVYLSVIMVSNLVLDIVKTLRIRLARIPAVSLFLILMFAGWARPMNIFILTMGDWLGFRLPPFDRYLEHSDTKLASSFLDLLFVDSLALVFNTVFFMVTGLWNLDEVLISLVPDVRSVLPISTSLSTFEGFLAQAFNVGIFLVFGSDHTLGHLTKFPLAPSSSPSVFSTPLMIEDLATFSTTRDDPFQATGFVSGNSDDLISGTESILFNIESTVTDGDVSAASVDSDSDITVVDVVLDNGEISLDSVVDEDKLDLVSSATAPTSELSRPETSSTSLNPEAPAFIPSRPPPAKPFVHSRKRREKRPVSRINVEPTRALNHLANNLVVRGPSNIQVSGAPNSNLDVLRNVSDNQQSIDETWKATRARRKLQEGC
ncbi:hypothetical protein C8J56DRAFT_910841 [Mycena floridula]|nr:hypothetical protein C8J56DRAFT_910841 [Mycena floridula]